MGSGTSAPFGPSGEQIPPPLSSMMMQSDLVVLEEPECIDSGHVASQVHHLSSKILSGRTSRSR